MGKAVGARSGFKGIRKFFELEGLFEGELWLIPHVLTTHMLGLGRHVKERMKQDAMRGVEGEIRVISPSRPEVTRGNASRCDRSSEGGYPLDFFMYSLRN